MPETKHIVFTHKEVAERLLRGQDIYEGHWGISVEFQIRGINIDVGNDGNLVPAALIPIKSIGIQQFDKPNSMTVDASKVNRKKAKKNS